MHPPRPEEFRRLAAEIRAELPRIDRTAEEAREAQDALDAPEVERLRLYGAAAILDTFYSAIEKALSRIAHELDGGIPSGPGLAGA